MNNRYVEQIYKTKYAKPEIFEWYSKKGTTSIFIYSPKVLKNGKLSYFNEENRAVRCVRNNGVVQVPASFFEKYLGFSALVDKDEITLTRGKRKLIAVVGESVCELSGKPVVFDSPVFKENGHIYLPAMKTAEVFGIESRAYDGGKLVVFAKKELLDEIENDDDLRVSASYATLGRYDASKFTKEDFASVKCKWRTVLVGNEEINDLKDPDFMAKVAEISARTKRTWDSLHKEEKRFILWGDAPPKASAELTVQYDNIWLLTKGYATFGSDYYKCEELKDTILSCLQWMYENMYGEAEIRNCGWRSMYAYNWWDWFVGGVDTLTNSLIVMEEYLTSEKIKTYLRPFKHVLTIHRVGYERPYAMSRLAVGTKAAVLLEDREMIENGCADYDLTLGVTRTEEGVHVDYVEWTHGFPYNMMYGINNLSRTGFIGTLLGGTPLEYVSPKQYELYNIAVYMFETACYKGQGFMGFNGRGTGSTEFISGVQILNGVLPLIGLFGKEEDMHLKKMIKRCASTKELVKMLKDFCSVYNFAKLMQILRDDSIPSENDYEIAHAWFTGDRFAQHRNDYAMLVALTSERHPSYESVNCANRRGWYTCDGATYLYTDADRNAYDGANFIMNPSVCQRVAGTTVDDRARQPWSYSYYDGWKSPRDFSGVMDVEKKYGMAAFEYESYNYQGHESDGTEDKDGGGGLTFWENDLVAKKSYYFFDKECVCLGAGISSSMDASVITTVEHRRLVKDGPSLGFEDIYVDGELMPKENFEKRISGACRISLEGFAGFVIPKKSEIRISKYTYLPDIAHPDEYFVEDPDAEKYKNGKPFFEINICHGKNPRRASYEYVILPSADREATESYANSPEVEVLQNNENIQAVKKSSLGLTFITFYKAGKFAGIRVSKPCILSVLDKNGKRSVAVADPTHKLKSITLTFDKSYHRPDASARVTVGEKCGQTVVFANVEGMTGEAVRFSFDT